MRGSVVKRTDAKGRRRYYVVVEEPDGGKRRRRWLTDPATGSAFTSSDAAEQYAARMVVAQADSAYVEPSRLTVDEWVTHWLSMVRPSLRPSTWASYERVLRVHVRPRIGARRLQRLSAADLDGLYAAMLSGGRADHAEGRPLAPRTVRNAAVIVSKALKDAQRKGLIVTNPALAADPPKVSAGAPRAVEAWNAADLATFLRRVEGTFYGPIFTFLAATGCRRGEALGLRWSDVDLEAKRARFVQTVQKVRGEVILGDTKTASSRRSVALDDDTVAMLRHQRVDLAARRLAVGEGWVDYDLVFPGPTGVPIYPETPSRMFRDTVRRAKLPAIPLHGLRHTWATLALTAGVHPKLVQERLGHSNIAVTLGIYSHATATMHDAAAETVAAMVRRPSR